MLKTYFWLITLHLLTVEGFPIAKSSQEHNEDSYEETGYPDSLSGSFYFRPTPRQPFLQPNHIPYPLTFPSGIASSSVDFEKQGVPSSNLFNPPPRITDSQWWPTWIQQSHPSRYTIHKEKKNDIAEVTNKKLRKNWKETLSYLTYDPENGGLDNSKSKKDTSIFDVVGLNRNEGDKQIDSSEKLADTLAAMDPPVNIERTTITTEVKNKDINKPEQSNALNRLTKNQSVDEIENNRRNVSSTSEIEASSNNYSIPEQESSDPSNTTKVGESSLNEGIKDVTESGDGFKEKQTQGILYISGYESENRKLEIPSEKEKSSEPFEMPETVSGDGNSGPNGKAESSSEANVEIVSYQVNSERSNLLGAIENQINSENNKEANVSKLNHGENTDSIRNTSMFEKEKPESGNLEQSESIQSEFVSESVLKNQNTLQLTDNPEIEQIVKESINTEERMVNLENKVKIEQIYNQQVMGPDEENVKTVQTESIHNERGEDLTKDMPVNELEGGALEEKGPDEEIKTPPVQKQVEDVSLILTNEKQSKPQEGSDEVIIEIKGDMTYASKNNSDVIKPAGEIMETNPLKVVLEEKMAINNNVLKFENIKLEILINDESSNEGIESGQLENNPGGDSNNEKESHQQERQLDNQGSQTENYDYTKEGDGEQEDQIVAPNNGFEEMTIIINNNSGTTEGQNNGSTNDDTYLLNNNQDDNSVRKISKILKDEIEDSKKETELDITKISDTTTGNDDNSNKDTPIGFDEKNHEFITEKNDNSEKDNENDFSKTDVSQVIEFEANTERVDNSENEQFNHTVFELITETYVHKNEKELDENIENLKDGGNDFVNLKISETYPPEINKETKVADDEAPQASNEEVTTYNSEEHITDITSPTTEAASGADVLEIYEEYHELHKDYPEESPISEYHNQDNESNQGDDKMNKDDISGSPETQEEERTIEPEDEYSEEATTEEENEEGGEESAQNMGNDEVDDSSGVLVPITNFETKETEIAQDNDEEEDNKPENAERAVKEELPPKPYENIDSKATGKISFKETELMPDQMK